MKKYRVTGTASVLCSMIVSAENEEEALEIANETYGGITSFVGRGSSEGLIGPTTVDDERSIYPDSEPVFDDCEELG